MVAEAERRANRQQRRLLVALAVDLGLEGLRAAAHRFVALLCGGLGGDLLLLPLLGLLHEGKELNNPLL